MYWHSLISILLVCGSVYGCTSTKRSRAGAAGGPTAFVVQVQSSYGDIQQVEVSVLEWMFEGADRRQFEKRMTPFEIPFAAGDFLLRLSCLPGAPQIKVQLLDGEGRPAGYVQSNEVCVRGAANGSVELENCMAGLR